MTDYWEQAIRDVANELGIAVSTVQWRISHYAAPNPWAVLTSYAVAQRERVLELEAQLRQKEGERNVG